MTNKVTSPQIDIVSKGPLIDDAFNIHLTGFTPGQRLTLKASMLDDFARQWEAYAEFQADEQGRVDVATQKPLAGTYNNADPMGIVWSMLPTGEKQNILFAKVQATHIPLLLSVEVAGETVTRVDMDRKLATPEIERTQVREAGLFGTFFQPAGSERVPAVLLFGGSSGGLNESKAALLASHGYAVLALAYFSYEQLPQYLVNIPLEYFATALDWLQAQPLVNGDRLAVMGQSKGGELALLLGATFPQIKSVVAYVPSSVVWRGLSGSYEQMLSKPSSWSYHGQPLPSVPMLYTSSSNTDSMPPPPQGQAISFTSLYLNSLSNTEAVERAAIPVEKTNGPVLLISAQDDALWPSTHFCELVMERLDKYTFPYAYQHLNYKGAGHLINYPYLPTTATASLQSNSGVTLLYGGNAQDTAFAAEDSWGKVLAFLQQHLQA
ncbi:MAG TPA: acyl-CoA thioester hydrolase/BAAT C-terminal domain-containing protein [Ktedonobacteraceae bacterium]|nr:acyl-CoA thioester hydrolase/BAAT C-terminal domain-containing protein [Ktedonobacteraceae bacterium]